MEKLLEIILFVVSILTNSLACSYAMYFINSAFAKKKYSLKEYLMNFAIFLPLAILNFVILFHIKSIKSLMPLIATIMCMLTSKFLYKNRWLKSIFAGFIYIVLTFLMDVLSVLVLSIFKVDLNFLNENKIHYFITSIIIYCVLALLVKAVSMIFGKIINNRSSKTSIINYKYILYQVLFILISLIPSMVLMFSNNYDYPIGFVMLNTFQLIIVSTFSVLYMKKQIHFKDTELELENTKLHNQALSTINENIRGFKHDMGNMVQAINGYLAVGNIDGVKKYCQNLLHGFNDVNLLSILSPKIINEPAIYGVVVSKMLYARENSLNLSLDIGLDVSSINFPSFELSRIIGILLDNAIEASLESNEKKLKLEMYYDDNKKADVIIIGNSVKDPDKVDVIKMFEKDYSTKENPSGFGLFEVLKFLKKNHKGDIVPNIDYDKNFFTQTLTFDK